MFRLKDDKLIFIYLFWLIWATISYLSHNPLPGLGNYFLGIFLLFFLLLIFFSTGKKALRFFLKDGSALSLGEEMLFSLGLGIGIWMMIIYFLGMFHLLSKKLVISIIVLSVLFLYKDLKTNIFSLKGKIADFLKRPVSAKIFLFYSAISIPLSLSLLGALAPTTFYDSLVYHLAEAGNYVRNGYLKPLDYNLFSHFPQNMEMLSTLALLVWDDLLANLFHWIFLPLCLVTIYFFCLHFINSGVGKIASLIFAFTPSVMLLAMGTYVELGLTFFSFLAIYSFFLWREQNSNPKGLPYNSTNNLQFIILTAVFSGLALGIKYTAGVYVLILGVGIFVVHSHRTKNYRQSFFLTGIFFLTAILIFSPWLIKNYHFVKNPFFPFLTNIFGAGNFSLENINSYLHHLKSYNPVAFSLSNLVFLPWLISFEPSRFGGGFDVLGTIWGGVYLIFLPTLFFMKKINRWLIIFSSLFFIFWVFSGQVLRFLFPILPCLSILVAQGSSELFSKKIIGFLLGIFFLGQIYLTLFIMSNWSPWKAVLTNQSSKEYLSRLLPYYDTMDYANRNLAKGSKILFLGELRGYYCQHNFIASTAFDQTPIVEWANRANDAEDLRKKIKSAGITHLLINFPELERLNNGYHILYFTPSGSKIKDDFKQEYLKEIYQKNQVVLYELTSED